MGPVVSFLFFNRGLFKAGRGGDACSCGGSGHGWGTLHSFPGGSAQRPLQEAPASPADSEFHPGVPAAGRWGPALGRSRVSCTEAQGQRSALCGHAAPAIGAGARRPRGPVLPVRVLSEAEGTVASRGWGTGHGSSLHARSDVPTACARRGASPLTPHSLGPTCSNGGDAGDPRSTVGARSDERGSSPGWLGAGTPWQASCMVPAGDWAGGRQETKATQGWECLSW